MATMREKLRLIADSYGYEAQARQLIEEMAELTVALNKQWRGSQKYMPCDEAIARQNVIEEIADVEVMLEQIKYLLGCDYEVFKEKMNKTNRTMERMNLNGKSV